MKHLRWIPMGLLLATSACDRGGTDLVAEAAGHDLTVEEAAGIVAALPAEVDAAQPEVVKAVADLWIDYTLLASAVAEDSTLAQVDLQPLVTQQQEIRMITALRDSVIQVDTALTDEQVRQRFTQAAPGVRVRARHILLAPPQGGTPAQRDSARALAEELLRRIRAGESFEQLAREYSADVTAEQGGDLGFFERGQMVAAFDSAAFALEPGEVSGVVATPFGYHIIRVDDREMPSFEDFREDLRLEMQAELFMRAESLYVAGVENRAGLEMQEGATEIVREVAQNPIAPLSGRAAGRSVVEFEGGEVTVDELRQFLQMRDPTYRQQVVNATDQQIVDNVLRSLANREILVAEARARGIVAELPGQDSLVAQAREGFRETARALGLVPVPAEGESQDEAIARVVDDLLRGIIRGEREVIPLGAIAFVLRQQYPVTVREAGVEQAVTRVTTLRASSRPDPFPGQMPGQEQGMPPGMPPSQAPDQAPGEPGGD